MRGHPSKDFGAHVQRALRELREGFSDDADALRRRCVELCSDVTDSLFAAWYVFGLVDGEPLPVDWVVTSGGESVLARQYHERLGWPTGDPRVPEGKWVGRFVALSSLVPTPAQREQVMASPIVARCWAPLGIHDQIRALVYSRGELVGWVGALRARGEPTFGRKDLTRLRAITAPLTEALVHAHGLSRASNPEESCDLVLDAAGRVELASSAASRVVSHPERAALLAAWARAADRGETPPAVLAGHRVRWVRLLGAHGSRYLLHLEPIEPLRLHPAFELSATQRRIAELAALGLTVHEIAEDLGSSVGTIKTHLRIAYERLGVSNRAELANALHPK